MFVISKGKIFLLFYILVLCSSTVLMGQNQEKVDSLKNILTNNTLVPDHKMAILARISITSSSPSEILLYAEKLLLLATRHEKHNYIVDAFHSKGVAYRLKGNLKLALENLFISANLASDYKEYKKQGEAYDEIANTYTTNKDFKNALVYNKKAIAIIRQHGTHEQLAITLLNTGYNYYTLNQLDSALVFYNEAEPIFKTTGLEIGKAYTVGNKALVYWKQGDKQTAEKNLLLAIKMLHPLGDEFGIADYHNQIARLYSEQGYAQNAIEHTTQALEIAQALNLKEQIRDSSLLLSELYESKNEYQKAFTYLNQYIAYKDSIESKETTRQIADLRTEYEVSQKEKKIVVLKKNQLLNRIYIIIAIFLLIVAILVLLYFRQRFQNTRLMADNERKEHDDKIRTLLNTQETKALQSMVKGQENERKRLAQELHNHFGSLMATIKVNLNAIDEKAIPNHTTLTTLVDQACADIRNLSHALNMGISDNFGLVPALKELTAHLQQANGLDVEFSASMCQEQMSSETEIIIYRIVQELVSNVLKHAEATKLSILLTCFDEEKLINIMVHDNGKGFDAEKKQKNNYGMGLNSLQEMINDLQGDIKFDSNPASGTTINIDLPLIPITLN